MLRTHEGYTLKIEQYDMTSVGEIVGKWSAEGGHVYKGLGHQGRDTKIKIKTLRRAKKEFGALGMYPIKVKINGKREVCVRNTGDEL